MKIHNKAKELDVYRGTITGLRISSVNGTAFIDNADITTDVINAKILHEGSIARENLRISAVNGTAFTDTPDATFGGNLTDHIGKYLIIRDSAGREHRGWIKAAGAGKTLGSDVFAGINFMSWSNGGAGHPDDADSYTSTDVGGIFKGISTTLGALYETLVNGSTTASLATLRNGDGTGYYTGEIIPAAAVAYRTAILEGLYFMNDSAGTTDITFATSYMKQVLTPSALGVTIVSTKGGTTYNWESKDPSFNYWDGDGYTYTIYDRDLTAFIDGEHLIEIYDASNRFMEGFLKAQGAGETLDNSIITDSGFDNDALWVKNNGWSIAGGKAVRTTGSGRRIMAILAYPQNGFFCGQFTIDSRTAGSVGMEYGLNAPLGSEQSNPGTYSSYITTTSAGDWLSLKSATPNFEGQCDNFTFKQVLTPSPLGATIVSAKGGETYNFSYKHASFAYNAASYFVRIKKVR